MSDFNSVPPASSNQYGNQVEESQADAGSASAQTNNSKQHDNSSMQRAGSNESAKSKGDKEGKSEDGIVQKAVKGKAMESAASYAAGKAAGGMAKAATAGVKQAMQSVVNMVKALPKAIVQTVATVVVSAFAGIIAAITSVGGAVSGIMDEPPKQVYVAYVDKGAIGVTNASVDDGALKREVARKIYTVMSGMDTMDHPDGLTYTNSETGQATSDKIQVSYGLRPEQIFGLLGNWEHESGLDPTAVEACFDDAYNIGQKKQFAIMNDFVTSMWGSWDSTTKSYFENHPTIFKAGIGLAQWTDTVEDTDTDGDYGEHWDIHSPGRNTKLLTYAALFGDEYYNRKDGITQSTGWNGEKWVKGDSNTETQWYDIRVQLAYALDTSSLGDSKASWLTTTWNDVGNDLWEGDEHIDLIASTMYDNTLQGWDVNQTFSSATGWVTSSFTIKDNKVTFNEDVNAIGDNTADKTNFKGTDVALEDNDTTDEYYNTDGNGALDAAAYVTLVNNNYSAWTTAKAGSVNWTDIGTAVNYKTDGTMPSGADAARNLAFVYANKTADLFWHGNLDDTDPLTQPLDATHQGYQHDFLMENDPRTYDLREYQDYYTADEAKVADIVSLRKGGGEGVGWHYTCATTEHDHSSGCNSSSCSHSGCDDCEGGDLDCTTEHEHGADCYTDEYCGHTSHTSSCCSLYHQHSQSTCSWEYYYVAGFVKTGNPCDKANSLAKQQYINCFKYYYRYHLYRYMSLYYSAQFAAEYEGNAGDAIASRFTKTNDWFNMWWQYSENEGTDYSEPNYYSPLDKTANAYGFKDYFFRTEQGYATGIQLAIERTQDSLERNQEDVKVYNHDIYMGDSINRENFVSNRDIAIAACLIAWPTRDASMSNDGTECYKHIHDAVLKGDTVYQSCDRTAATAIRWSGVDDNFPGGPTLTQIQYLTSSPRWTEVIWGGDVNQLQPGDVLIRKDSLAAGSAFEGGGIDDGGDGGGAHHILIYTGNYFCDSYDGVKNTPDNLNIVHGSYGSRSPGMDNLYDSLRSYHAFRCTDPQEAQTSKYNSIKYSEP